MKCKGLTPSDCNNPDCPVHGHVEAAALTEQIAELLAEHRSMRLGKLGDPRQWECWCGHELGPLGIDELRLEDDHRAHLAEVLAARLADSRPVVSEAAELARLRESLDEANHALKNGATYHDQVCAYSWMLRDLHDRIGVLADELEQQHKDAFGESLADNFPSALVTDLRDLLNSFRLSPTGDDSE